MVKRTQHGVTSRFAVCRPTSGDGCPAPPHLHRAQHAPHCVGDELGGGGQLVVLLAAHLHHVAPLALKELWGGGGEQRRG